VERALIHRAQHGDRDAFSQLAHAWGGRLYAVAFRVLREPDAAADAVQATLITAWRDLPRLRDPDRVDAWLQRILVRRCYAEAARRRRIVTDLSIVQDREDAGDAYATVAVRDEIERGFRRLGPDQRAVLVLHHYLGMTPHEIAATLGLADGTVRSRLHYAHRAMRALLDADARYAQVTEGPA
jgi:RNA polymerase sigma-70 factor (ECF subfamily)